MVFRRTSDLCVVVCLVASVSGCTSVGGDKAGAPAEPIVLRMAYTGIGLGDPGQPLFGFAQRLLTLSAGTMRVEFSEGWGQFQPDNEEQVVTAVASDQVELGLAGVRVFDSVGVSSFEALLAPMLIDSRPLQEAVMASDVPGQMLEGLKSVGVTGLGISPDGLRRPFSESRPLLQLTDWRGVGFGTARSRIQEETISHLGAVPIEAVGAFAENAIMGGRITAFASDLGGYANHTAAVAPVRFGTSNVVLWPAFAVLFVNSDVIASLDQQQRAWMQQAGEVWSDASEERQRLDELDALKDSCRKGAQFAAATSLALERLRRALMPVYERIEEDARTASYIQQIRDLKRAILAPELTIPPNCRWKRGG